MVWRDNFRNLSEEEKVVFELFEHCSLCDFFPCEQINSYLQYGSNNPESDSFSYNPDERSCHIRHWIQISCTPSVQLPSDKVVYVADGIGDHYQIDLKRNKDIDRWESSQPVVISAQTGSGKNYFIENVLVEHVRKLNHKNRTRHKILILSNRIALRLQMADRLNNKHLNEDGNENKIYSPNDNVDVMSYQSFVRRLDTMKVRQGKLKDRRPLYLFVICDEAHYFASDAMFNPYTDKTLFNITRIFDEAIRVYMSATPYECLEHIMRHEATAVSQATTGVFYHFARNYSYLNAKYYSELDELKEIIESSGNENWLIFLDNKKKCQTLKAELEEISTLKGRVYAVSAESKDDEVYQRMVVEERIDVFIRGKHGEILPKIRVLIATSVIDNGVNFRNIQNVVTSDISRVKTLQMLGRARVAKGERVTHYIKRFTEDELTFRIDKLKEQQDVYHDYRTSSKGNQLWFREKYCYGIEENWKNTKHWFGRNDGFLDKLFPNDIAVSLVDSLVPTYKSILEEMQRSDPAELPGQKYLEYQLSWLGKKYSRENDITLKDKDEGLKSLLEFLNSYADNNNKIFASDQGKFKEELAGLIDNTFGKQDKNSRTYGSSKINRIFEEHNIGYGIEQVRETTGKRQTYWTIVKSSSTAQRGDNNA